AVVRRRRAGAARELPLRLGRQRDREAAAFGEPPAERVGVVPAHEADRMVVALREARGAPGEVLLLLEGLAVPAEAARVAALGLGQIFRVGGEARELRA